MEFHISRQARDRYKFDEMLFNLHGNVIFANFQASRTFAQKINQQRDLLNHPEQAVQAGEINAMGLIDEILHVVIATYRQQVSPEIWAKALEWLNARLGAQDVEHSLGEFIAEFPPLALYRGESSLAEYLGGTTDGLPNQQAVLEEMLMLWLDNKNPAFLLREELFDDTHLSAESAYSPIIAELYRFFETQPYFGPEKQNLIDLLRTPAVNYPHSLFAQLDFIRERWIELLGSRFADLLRRLMTSLDLIREEQMQRGFAGPGPIEVPKYGASTGVEPEVENFSLDRDWMPRLVLIAKNTYVWLDQLSQVYQRRITRLDQIPDEELEKLARWGFSGLWLIGLWERSRASARIKQMMGNPEALASAYSLYDYRIADDLGGEDAYNGLREKAWRYGIRLASDMVPNHMGIDSPWVADHPDWFLSLDYSPYPAYTFGSPDLSEDGRVSIHLEDHYFTRSDASVVFKLYDHRDGSDHYIYHGNDGTTMPWNDTAQLNYLLPQVREAVIQTILSVARRFPIIRFDAAMTLAKLHFQRLWFPQPGSAGAIPSRAEFGMSKEQFDQLMPVEFWREVVDRMAQEAPDTLLLAEAFWMMEGYFVRTLGMHRVYNSAFMNLLRNEENAKYRLIMKNTLEFDPEILKRYVNFMNNPDERTAVDQFGKGDKYFGIAMLMATMPGLPMFGHGQVEGFSEKYGMEYKRSYWNEQPDPFLIERHQREIFPLLHR
ncbi:MAG: alpha-amylase, partial [Anaerolineaceae bacterium]|nr:alpha-amylase [Anaerolineaceae bacterium]